MEAHGELTRLGFDCALCKSDKELRAYRGCGVAPDLDAGAGGLPTYDERGRLIPRVISTWDGHAYVDAHYKEHPNVPLDPISASEVYMHAAQVWVWEFTGELWPWCPAWFSRFAEGPHVAFADRVIHLASLAKRGLLVWAAREPPTGVEVDGVNCVLALGERLKNDAEDRAIQEAKNRGKE